MTKKKLSIYYALTIALFVCVVNNVQAQWMLSGSDLKTDITGGFGPFNNVIIDNNLYVNLSAAPSCPITTGGGGTGSYPLVVNVHNAPMVLWDEGTDIIRNIIGLSVKGGITMLSGDNYTNSAGIMLTSPGAAPALIGSPPIFPVYPGSVTTLSNGSTFSSADANRLAYGQGHYDDGTGGGSPALTQLFAITRAGNARIGNNYPTTDKLTVDGSLCLWGGNTYPNDFYRNMYARSTYAGMNITSGALTDGSDGACLTEVARVNSITPTPGIESPLGNPTPGAFIVKSNAPNYFAGGGNRAPLGYAYQNYTPPSFGLPGGTLHNNFLISSDGNGIFGQDVQLSNIQNADVFTVKRALGMYDKDDASRRSIDGNTYTGLLSINSAVSSTNGTTIEMYGANHTATPDYQGQIHYISSLHGSAVGHKFQNWNGTGWKELMNISNNANLQTGSNIFMDVAGDAPKTIAGNSSHYWLGVCSGHGGGSGTDGSYIQMFTNGYTGAPGSMFVVTSGNTTSGTSFIYEPPMGSGPTTTAMTVRNDGAVIIGNVPTPHVGTPSLTNGYRLYVQYGILTEQVRVSLASTLDWSDYVFAKDYKLMPLKNVENFIKVNNHLPDVPSAAEVVNQGIDLGKMDAKLLQKIEELTLYVIAQQKRIDVLEAKLETKK